MPRVFRQQYTRPIPPDAKRVTIQNKKGQDIPAVRFKSDDGKTVTAPLTKTGDRCRVASPVWYGQYTDADGQTQRVPLCENKTAAEQMLADLVRKAALGQQGIRNPFEQHYRRPLSEHLEEWSASLLASGAKPKHVKQTINCARKVLDGCRFVFVGDLSASSVQNFLARLREIGKPLPPLDPAKELYTRNELAKTLSVKPNAIPPMIVRHRLEAIGYGKSRRYPRVTAEALHALRTKGRSIKTSNLYLDAIKGFAAWLVQDRRTGDNPLVHLEGGNVKLDRRHDRQTLSPNQLATILAAANGSERTFRGLTGVDRYALYLCGMGTGFRAGELSTLRPQSFNLDNEPPTATVPTAFTKNSKLAIQPLPPDVVDGLRAYLKDRPAGEAIWPGLWHEDAAEMLRIDLEAAGIAYIIEGPDGPLYADFHSLRHSYIAMLDKAGATLKEAMQLARHSDPKLTMAVYGRAQLHDLGATVERLPSVLTIAGNSAATALGATGTDPHPGSAYTPLTQTPDSGRENLRVLEPTGSEEHPAPSTTQPPGSQGVESEREPVRVSERSSPSRTRTYNKPVNSRFIIGCKDWRGQHFRRTHFPAFRSACAA